METLLALVGNGGQQEEARSSGDTDYSSRRILLAEDIALNQEIAMEILSMTGVQVEVADNGRETVEKFEASPEGYFDIIFMDIQMPVMDGYEATKLIRRLHRKDAENVWIVAMTANAVCGGYPAVQGSRHERALFQAGGSRTPAGYSAGAFRVIRYPKPCTWYLRVTGESRRLSKAGSKGIGEGMRV